MSIDKSKKFLYLERNYSLLQETLFTEVIYVSVSVLRTVILYFLLMFAMRIMGKRQLGELQPSEFIVTLLLSDLAAVPMQDNALPLFNGVLPILVLVALELFVSGALLKIPKIAKLISGSPIAIINDGKIDIKAMKKLRLTIDDLTESLRQKDIFEIESVQYAVAETNGTISAYCYPQYQTVTQRDMKLKSKDSMPVPIIGDGTISQWALSLIGHDEKWLYRYLEKKGYAVEDVFIMAADKSDRIYLVPYDRIEECDESSKDCG